MGFKVYRITPEPDQTWRLEQPEPLRFAGPNGLIARWYRENRGEIGDRAWLAPAQTWLELALGAEGAAGRWIVFEQFEGDQPRYARLEAVNGQFGSQTRLMFQFRPLTPRAQTTGLVVAEPEFVCGWGEELSIDGGDGSASCSWRWQTPKLSFASVIAGAGRKPA